MIIHKSSQSTLNNSQEHCCRKKRSWKKKNKTKYSRSQHVFNMAQAGAWKMTHWPVKPAAHLCACAPLHRHGPALTLPQSVPGNPKQGCPRSHFRKRHHLKSCSPKLPLPFLSRYLFTMFPWHWPPNHETWYITWGLKFWGKEDKGKIGISWSEIWKIAQIFTARSGTQSARWFLLTPNGHESPPPMAVIFWSYYSLSKKATHQDLISRLIFWTKV